MTRIYEQRDGVPVSTNAAETSAGVVDADRIPQLGAAGVLDPSLIAVFTSVLNGLTPLSGGGTANYLRADGTWAAPPGATAGTVTSVSVVTANGVSGTVATATTTPAITLTLGAITPSSVSATGTISGTNITAGGDVIGNAATATKFVTGRTISITGDGTWTSGSFDGSVNVTAALTLTTVNANTGVWGSATQVAQITLDAKGRATAAANVTITPAASSITGGAALTKTDDTNVTLTLGGTPATALLKATSITVGWTGRLAYSRFISATQKALVGATAAGDFGEITLGSGVAITAGVLSATGSGGTVTTVSVVTANGFSGTVATATTTPAITLSYAGAALTKTDDTNVTLTLGGTPATALLQAASLTLGWTGTLGVARGGTNIASYAVGDLLQASASATLAKLPAVATGNVLISGGVTTVSSWGKAGLTTHVSGTLPIANGGTNQTSLGNITKTDDTNVTLTLGGTPTGAVITSTSFTLGWTGTLAVSRGGTGIASFGTGIATWLGTPSSANLAAAMTDETGSGALVFANTPTLVTPVIGAATGTSFVPGTSSATFASTAQARYFYNSSFGCVFGGAGSVLDMLAVNAAGSTLFSVNTGTQNVDYAGNITVAGTTASTGAVTSSASIRASTYLKSGSTTVASLPVAATAGAGARHFVTDALGPTFLTAVVGGGAIATPVFSDGTIWRAG